MDTIEDFEYLKTQLQDLTFASSQLALALPFITPTADVTSAEQMLTNVISTLQSFVTTNLNALEGQEVVNEFIAELKVVMDKYTASISITDSEGGYGVGYGEGGTPSITLKATLDGITGSKTFNVSSLVGDDL